MVRTGCIVCICVLGLCLAACSPPCPSIEGSWEGMAGESHVVFQFHADGQGSIRISGEGRTSTVPCRWSHADQRLHVTSDRGAVRSFPVKGCPDGDLLLQLGAGSAGLCRMRRIDRG